MHSQDRNSNLVFVLYFGKTITAIGSLRFSLFSYRHTSKTVPSLRFCRNYNSLLCTTLTEN